MAMSCSIETACMSAILQKRDDVTTQQWKWHGWRCWEIVDGLKMLDEALWTIACMSDWIPKKLEMFC